MRGGIEMIKRLKRIFHTAWKIVGIICIALVGVLIICGLPLNELKEKLSKIMK